MSLDTWWKGTGPMGRAYKNRDLTDADPLKVVSTVDLAYWRRLGVEPQSTENVDGEYMRVEVFAWQALLVNALVGWPEKFTRNAIARCGDVTFRDAFNTVLDLSGFYAAAVMLDLPSDDPNVVIWKGGASAFRARRRTSEP